MNERVFPPSNLTLITTRLEIRLGYSQFAIGVQRESKTVLDSGFHTVDSRFQVLDSSLCKWNLHSGFQSLMGFRIP